MLSTITSKGQITIPSDIRRDLGLKPGDQIFFESSRIDNKTMTLKAFPRMTVDELYGSLHSDIPYAPMEVVRKSVGKYLGKKYAAS